MEFIKECLRVVLKMVVEYVVMKKVKKKGVDELRRGLVIIIIELFFVLVDYVF